MSITPVLAPHRYANIYPGNEHTFGPNGSVTGAAMMRVAMTMVIPAEDSPARADLEQALLEQHRRPGRSYGLALVESQIFSVMMFVDPAVIEQFQAGRVQLRNTPGVVTYGGWPTYGIGPWEEIIPDLTWHPGGVGVLAELEGVDGAKVTVYEFTVDKAQAWNSNDPASGELMNMVSWHCDRCHSPYEVELDERWENRGPNDRQWAYRHASRHARGLDGKCTVPDGELERIASEVVSKMQGRTVEIPALIARCQSAEGCSRVRLARATTARLASAPPAGDGRN